MIRGAFYSNSRMLKHFTLEFPTANYRLEYSQSFSNVVETVLIDVGQDNAVDPHLRFT